MPQLEQQLDLEELQISSFVTMLDQDQQEQVAGGWSSAWYHTCISSETPGTGFCESTFSFDGTDCCTKV